MYRRVRLRKPTVVQRRTTIVLRTDPFSPGKTGIHETRWAAVQVHDEIESVGEESKSRREFAADGQDFIEIWISAEAICKAMLHQHRQPESREFLLQGTNRRGEQKAVAHRAETYKEDPGVRGKSLKKIFSLQLSLR